MTDIGDLAAAYVDSLVIPAGPGLDVIRERGRRRRRRSVAITALACAAVVSLVGIGVATLWGGRTQSVSAVDEGTDSQRSDQVEAVDLDTQLVDLEDWDETELPLIPTPSLSGWSIETIRVVSDRFYSSGTSATYLVRAAGEELSVEIFSGQVELAGSDRESVVIDRPGGPLPAVLLRTGDEVTMLWNERPGVNTGTAVAIRGSDADSVIAAGEALELVDVPLAGAASPVTRSLSPDRIVLLQGVTSNVSWQVSRSGTEMPVLDVGGLAPVTTGELLRLPTNGPDVVVDSVSFDGLQVNMLRIPNDATAELIDAEKDKIQLPTVMVEGTSYSIAVAPIPAGKQAAVVVVSDASGSQTSVGLPWIPAGGWSSITLSYTNSDN